jgi:hypothetical protein
MLRTVRSEEMKILPGPNFSAKKAGNPVLESFLPISLGHLQNEILA